LRARVGDTLTRVPAGDASRARGFNPTDTASTAPRPNTPANPANAATPITPGWAGGEGGTASATNPAAETPSAARAFAGAPQWPPAAVGPTRVEPAPPADPAWRPGPDASQVDPVESAAREALFARWRFDQPPSLDASGFTPMSPSAVIDESYAYDFDAIAQELDGGEYSVLEGQGTSVLEGPTPLVLEGPGTSVLQGQGPAVPSPVVWPAESPPLASGPGGMTFNGPIGGEPLPLSESFGDSIVPGSMPGEGLPPGSVILGPPELCETCEPTLGQLLRSKFDQWTFNAADRILATRQHVDAGMGTLWVEHAPLVLDTTQPRRQIRLRLDAGQGMVYPDRSTYRWAPPGTGPNYPGKSTTRDFKLMFELGSDALSVQTELPLRGYTAEEGFSQSGFGDMEITQKLRIKNGNRIQISQMMRIYTPTGNIATGKGNGHTTLEPGVLARFKQSDWTYFHGEIKYWIPLGADPTFSGQILTYGVGMSTVWHETLTSAWIPTLEMQSLNFSGGKKTGPGNVALPVKDPTAMIYPGIRFVRDSGGDLGVMEFGAAYGIGFTEERTFDSLLRLELKFSH
jgi:hypothetical protein